MSGCRITKVKFKNGGMVHVLPTPQRAQTVLNFGWGEVIFRTFDGEQPRLRDIYYMADLAKKLAYDNAED